MSILLSTLFSRKPRQNDDHSYEPIPDCPRPGKDLSLGLKPAKPSNCTSWLLQLSVWAFFAFSVGFTLMMQRRRLPFSRNIAEPTEKAYHETFPTLFSLVTQNSDGNGNYSFVYATHNPYYDLFQENPDLLLLSSKSNVRSRQEHVPTIRWSISEMRNAEITITLEVSSVVGTQRKILHRSDSGDLLVLSCVDEDDVNSGPTVLEVASLDQMRVTHRRNLERLDPSEKQRISPLYSSLKRDENDQLVQTEYWYINYVPSTLLRQNDCHWTYVRFDPPKNQEGAIASGQLQQELVLLPNWYIASAQSNVLNFAKYNGQPSGIHLAFTSRPDRVLIQFITGSSKGTPVVEYSELTTTKSSPFLLHSSPKQALGTTETYSATDMCQEPANITGPGRFISPGNLHTVALVELNANAVYQYRVGIETGQGVVWNSGTFHLTTARAAGDHPSEFSFLVYGDQGCPPTGWEDGTLWVKGMASRENGISMIHHVGDLSYADGAAHIWDGWMDMIQPISVSVPIMVAVGNHEYDHTTGGGAEKDPSHFVTTESGFMPIWGNFGNDSGGECGVPTSKRFTMPAGDVDTNPNNGVFWYWFDYGLLRTVVLSSEHDMSVGSVQHTWFETVLRTTNRTITPWVIVELHRPLYEGEEINSNYYMGVAMRYEIEDLLFDYQVDVVFAGHYHAYYRSCDGLYRSQCNSGGPTHITVGTAGAHLHDAMPMADRPWTANAIFQIFGYGRVTIQNATALHFEFIRAGYEPNDPQAGTVLDDVWIYRNDQR